MKKLIILFVIFSFIGLNSESKPVSKNYLPFAPKVKTGKHKTWNQKRVKHHSINCYKWLKK